MDVWDDVTIKRERVLQCRIQECRIKERQIQECQIQGHQILEHQIYARRILKFQTPEHPNFELKLTKC